MTLLRGGNKSGRHFNPSILVVIIRPVLAAEKCLCPNLIQNKQNGKYSKILCCHHYGVFRGSLNSTCHVCVHFVLL